MDNGKEKCECPACTMKDALTTSADALRAKYGVMEVELATNAEKVAIALAGLVTMGMKAGGFEAIAAPIVGDKLAEAVSGIVAEALRAKVGDNNEPAARAMVDRIASAQQEIRSKIKEYKAKARAALGVAEVAELDRAEAAPVPQGAQDIAAQALKKAAEGGTTLH